MVDKISSPLSKGCESVADRWWATHVLTVIYHSFQRQVNKIEHALEMEPKPTEVKVMRRTL